jgi:hypothetical protein
MLDISDTVVPKSDQLNADDLICGPRTITITGIKKVSDTKQPVVISFDGDNGPRPPMQKNTTTHFNQEQIK